MGVVSPDEFEALLGELGSDEFIMFVADLWAARGLDTTVVGDIVVGSTAGGHESVRIRVWSRRDLPWRYLPIPAGLSVTPDDLANADVLVTNTDSHNLREAAEAIEAGYVGPERLRMLLLYAIDRDVAKKLFRRHFDRSLDTDRKAETAIGRIRSSLASERRSPRVGERLPGDTNDVRTVVSIGIVAIALVVATVVVAGLPGRVPALARPLDGIGGVGQDVEGDQLSDKYPPGVNRSGLEDPSVLTAAHVNALEEGSYHLTIRSISRRSADFSRSLRGIQRTGESFSDTGSDWRAC